MNGISENEFFHDIKQSVNKLNDKLDAINNNLRHFDLEPLSNGKGKGSLEKQFRNNPEGFGAFGPVEDFIQESLGVVDKFNKYSSDFSMSWEVEKRKNREKFEASLAQSKLERKAERRDMWTLWGQKLIRWVIGVIVAIVLYSSLVLASEVCGFIKIPIKDWLPQHSKAQI